MGNAINSHPVERDHAVGRVLERERLASVGGRTLKRGGKPLFITDKDQDFEHWELSYLTSIQ